MTHRRDLDALQQHQDQGNARYCSLHGAVLSCIHSALIRTECLDDGQAQDTLCGDEAVRKIPATSPSWLGHNKRTLLF
jgi:hypothetical protein